MIPETHKPLTTVAALVKNPEGKLLFLKSPKWKGRWALPAGKVEYGENLVEAVRREVKEETHLDVDHLQSLLVQEICEPGDFHLPAHFISHAYLATVRDSEVIRNHESVDHCWKSPADALELDLNSPTRELLDHPLTRQALGGTPAPSMEQSMGQVIVDRLEFECIIGILPEERVTPQPLRLTITLEACFEMARKSEDVANTVDYFQLAQSAQSLITENKFQLLETLAEEVAALCLEDLRVFRARIRAEKPQAIPGADCSAVEICRDQRHH